MAENQKRCKSEKKHLSNGDNVDHNLENFPVAHKRQDANYYARRDRQGHDWFRHDETGTTPEHNSNTLCATIGQPQMQAYGETSKRSQITENVATSQLRRIAREERSRNHDKIYGTEETWYRHDGPASSPSRTSGIKRVFGNAQSSSDDWFKHDRSAQDLNLCIGEDSLIKLLDVIDAEEILSSAASNQAQYGMKDVENINHFKGVELAREVDSRMRCTCGGDWFMDHVSSVKEPHCLNGSCQRGYHGRPKDGELNPILRTTQESESWFDHEANKNFTSPRPSVRGSEVAYNKARNGQQMCDVLHME